MCVKAKKNQSRQSDNGRVTEPIQLSARSTYRKTLVVVGVSRTMKPIGSAVQLGVGQDSGWIVLVTHQSKFCT